MISLKLDHSHSHHLPCHPTRSYIEEQASISETDREQLSDDEYEDKNEYISLKDSHNNEFKIVDSRVNNDVVDSVEIIPLKKKKKPVSKLTPQEIYHADVIDQAFQESLKGVPAKIREMIMQKQKLVEDKVYLGISQKGSELLERMYQQIDTKTHLKDCIQENLNQMMIDIQSQLEIDILNGDRYVIHKIIRSTKNDLINNRKRKVIQGLTFHSSITGQNHTSRDDSQSYVSQSQNSHPSQQDFSLKSQKTRKAQEFIKKIQQEQHEQRKRRKQESERKKSLEVRSMQQKRQFQQQIKSERRNYLKRRIEAKRQIKSKQHEIREKMNKQYKEFLKKYKNKTPLFKQKQQIFNQKLQEQRKKEESALEKRREQRRSINIQEIREHEKKYQQFKSQKLIQKSHEKKLSTIETSNNAQYFKSRYHEILAEEEQKQKQRQVKEDPKLIRSQLLKKRDIYAKEVRKNYFPKSDEAKQKQLQQIVQKLQWTNKLKDGRLDIKQRNMAGNEYLRRLHQLIADLRASNKLPAISKTIDYDELQKSTRPQYKNYLEELRSSRRKYSVDYSRIAEVDLEDAHFQAKKLEEKAKRRQAYVVGGNFNIDRTLAERKKIDDEYLQSVKAKMALLNKYD